jgi:carbon-monoxide dehydrogenase medium subunit
VERHPKSQVCNCSLNVQGVTIVYNFNYHRPESVADAIAVLKSNSEAKALSGGMTFLPTMKMRLAQPSDVVDLGAIAELHGISQDKDGLTIGAMTTHGEIAASADVAAAIPALAALAGNIGDAQVRNRGTIGGSVANADPAADYPAALVALDATVTTDRRQIAAADFFTALFETALEDDELVTSVHFPIPKRAAYAKFPNPASRYAIVGVFVAKGANGVRVAVTGAGSSVFRVAEMEAALTANFAASAIEGISVSAADLNSDIHASAEYRAHLVGVMARRAVAGCA